MHVLKRFLASPIVGLTWGRMFFVVFGLLVIAMIIDTLFPVIYQLSGIPELVYEFILVAVGTPLLWIVAKGGRHQ